MGQGPGVSKHKSRVTNVSDPRRRHLFLRVLAVRVPFTLHLAPSLYYTFIFMQVGAEFDYCQLSISP